MTGTYLLEIDGDGRLTMTEDDDPCEGGIRIFPAAFWESVAHNYFGFKHRLFGFRTVKRSES